MMYDDYDGHLTDDETDYEAMMIQACRDNDLAKLRQSLCHTSPYFDFNEALKILCLFR